MTAEQRNGTSTRPRWSALVAGVALLGLATACSRGGEQADSTSTTTVAPPPTTSRPTTTTTPDYTTPPPYLVTDNLRGDALKAATAYARAEHAVVEAQNEPGDPDLPELVATHTPSFLADRQAVIRDHIAKGEATKFNDVFTIRVLSSVQTSPSEWLLTTCATTDYSAYAVGQPMTREPANSFRDQATVELVQGTWLVDSRLQKDIFQGKASCDK